MESGVVQRQNGHLRLHPKRLVADKGYTSHAFRKYLHQRNIRCTIPHRANEHHKGTFNKQIYRKRNIVERLINRLKQFRRIATRYEKRAANFSAMIVLASIFLFSNGEYPLTTRRTCVILLVIRNRQNDKISNDQVHAQRLPADVPR